MSGHNNVEISVVVPLYRSENCLDELVDRVSSVLVKAEIPFELILVDDGSPDNSWSIVCRLAPERPWMKAVRLSRNFGQHYAITAGVAAAHGNWIVVMDCDLQQIPEDIIRLHDRAREGYDLVLGLREKRTENSLRVLFSRIFYKLLNASLGINLDARVGSFRIMSRRLALHYLSLHERIRLFGPLVEWFGFPKSYISVQSHESKRGRSSYTFRKLLHLAEDALVLSSDKVLRLSMCGGIVSAVVSLLFGFYLLAASLYSRSPVAGWTSLIVTLTFFSGISVALIGLIGLYLGKLLHEARSRPLYVIDTTINCALDNAPSPA